MEKREPVMEAIQLGIGYHPNKKSETAIHSDLSFRLFPGELTCLLGPNGAGKSTLLRTLAAAQPPLSGKLLLEGEPLGRFSEKERSRKIGVVFTDKTYAGGLTVYELVALGRYPHTGFFGRLNRQDHALVQQAIEATGISHKTGSYIAELSDGERQKVMIAKALVQECPVIILDEPTAFLDIISRIEIMSLLHTIAVDLHKTILLSTHDVEQALILADKLWLLSPTNGLSCGTTEDIILGNHMDRLFREDTILFDKLHGIYYPKVSWNSFIRVDAADDILEHWTVNALNRNNYGCILRGEAPENIPLLSVTAPDRLQLTSGNLTRSFTSFEALLTYLPSIRRGE